jgi:hypothetical protein
LYEGFDARNRKNINTRNAIKLLKSPDYGFTIEPYVYVGITNQHILLYNTLDGITLESEKIEVIELLQEMLQEENCGVALLTNERYK